MNQACATDDGDSSAEQEPMTGDRGWDTSHSSLDNEDKVRPEDEGQGQEPSSDEEQGQGPSYSEEHEQEPEHEEHQDQESSHGQNNDAEPTQRAVENTAQEVPPTQEIQPIQEIQPVEEIKPVPMVDQPQGPPANDETPAVEQVTMEGSHEGSCSWKLWRCWRGTWDCCGTCLVDDECIRDVFDVEPPELLCMSRLMDRIYQ